jgi:hypothetical protein
VDYYRHPGCPQAGVEKEHVEADGFSFDHNGHGKAVIFYTTTEDGYLKDHVAGYSHVRRVRLCPPTDIDVKTDTSSTPASE